MEIEGQPILLRVCTTWIIWSWVIRITPLRTGEWLCLISRTATRIPVLGCRMCRMGCIRIRYLNEICWIRDNKPIRMWDSHLKKMMARCRREGLDKKMFRRDSRAGRRFQYPVKTSQASTYNPYTHLKCLQCMRCPKLWQISGGARARTEEIEFNIRPQVSTRCSKLLKVIRWPLQIYNTKWT